VWQMTKLARHGVTAEHMPFGVDKDVFQPRERKAHERPMLVAVGRLAIEKRFDVVVDAMGRLPEATLVIYGDGPERARLEKRAPENVQFAGFLKDKARLAEALSDADALVHGCPHETFGIAIAESIACGTPVLVPDEGGAAELAKPAFSETYRAGDAEACAAAVKRLLSRDVRGAALGASASILASKEHVEKLVERYEALLHAKSRS